MEGKQVLEIKVVLVLEDVVVSYFHLCPLCHPVEGPPLRSWGLKGAPVTAWLDPGKTIWQFHPNSRRSDPPGIRPRTRSWFYTPGRAGAGSHR